MTDIKRRQLLIEPGEGLLLVTSSLHAATRLAAIAEPLSTTYHGVMTTGDLGIGSTNTSFGFASPDVSRVSVTVTINGYTQEEWDDC